MSGSASLLDPVALETEEEKLEKWENERDELDAGDAVGDYECPAGMSVVDVPVVVNM